MLQHASAAKRAAERGLQAANPARGPRLAYMRAAWSISVAPPGAAEVSDSGKILIVFEKQPDGSWLTVADAWNPDLPPEN